MKYSILKYNSIKPLVINNIKPLVINNIVAPHGITDISHSLETKNFKKLISINLFSYLFTDITAKINLDIISDSLFLFLSVVHFKNDFPFIERKRTIISSVFVSSLFIINNFLKSQFEIYFFLMYMSFIHVPLHYKENWWHIKKKPILNSILIFIVAIFSNIIYENYILTKNRIISKFVKSIVISHIIYSEKYNKKNLITNI